MATSNIYNQMIVQPACVQNSMIRSTIGYNCSKIARMRLHESTHATQPQPIYHFKDQSHLGGRYFENSSSLVRFRQASTINMMPAIVTGTKIQISKSRCGEKYTTELLRYENFESQRISSNGFMDNLYVPSQKMGFKYQR